MQNDPERYTITVVSCTDHDDGSATLVVDVSYDALIAFAQIGLQTALIEAAESVIADGTLAKEDAGRGDDDGEDGQAFQGS